MNTFRIILFVLLGYLLWKMIQNVLRIMARDRQEKSGRVYESAKQPHTPRQNFSDVRDAKFEDLPPKETKNATDSSAQGDGH